MNNHQQQHEDYSEQLTRIARSLAAARDHEVIGDVAAGTDPEFVRMFTEDNVQKRFDKIRHQVEVIEPGFEELDELLSLFIDQLPLSSYDTGASDGDRFLQWIEQTQELSAEQCDLIDCQRARHIVESLGRKNRFGHIRFQQKWSTAASQSSELDSKRDLNIHLNPIRVWSRFHTNLLVDDDTVLPADVVFFACTNEVRTAVLESEGKRRLNDLELLGTCTIDEWRAWRGACDTAASPTREELIEICRGLAEMGLIAFS